MGNKTSRITPLNEVCPICYENMNNVDNISETDCNHVFCESCIRVWLENNKTCPFCRATISNSNIAVITNKEDSNKDDDNKLPTKMEHLKQLIEDRKSNEN